MTDKKNEERRKHKRYKVANCTVSTGKRFGEIIDISMGGFAFRYVDTGVRPSLYNEPVNGNSVIFGNDDLCLHDLPFKIISDHSIGTGVTSVKRCGIEFQNLTPKQISLLEQFILVNRVAEEDTFST